DVTAADNLSLGRVAHIDHLAANPRFRFSRGDLLDAAFMADLFSASTRYDVVVHLAANSDIATSNARPEIEFDNTLSTTFRVLECMRARGLDRVIFASTSAIYGEAPGRIIEDQGPLRPVSH